MQIIVTSIDANEAVMPGIRQTMVRYRLRFAVSHLRMTSREESEKAGVLHAHR